MSVICYHLHQVKWFHNSKRIHSTHDPRIVEDGFTTTLTIFSAQLTDLGEYSCEIYNGNGEKQTSSAKLTVQPERKKSSGRPPEFIDAFKDMSVCEGQDVNLVCKVRGTPTPKVIWLYNHRPIHESGDFKFYHENFSHRLHIVEVLPEDEGVYSCKAINSLGEKQINAELFVEEQRQGVESNKGQNTSARPSFLIHVEDAKCWEGKGATFDCKLTGLPEPEIQWYHDGKEIEASNQGHYIIDRGNNGNCMLIIPHATVSDAGEYACVAKSTIGTAHSIAELVVIEGRFFTYHSLKYPSSATMICSSMLQNVRILNEKRMKTKHMHKVFKMPWYVILVQRLKNINHIMVQ